MQPAKPAQFRKTECLAHTVGNFEAILRAIGRCGVDGSGGALFSSHPRLRTVGAGVGVQLLNNTDFGDAPDSWVADEAYLASRVPGKQTVPRAEAWAIYLVLKVWDGTFDLEIVTDATYSISGMDFRNRRKHLRGSNKDIWNIIYRELDRTLQDADSPIG